MDTLRGVMKLSVLVAALVAIIVGFGSSVIIVLAAAESLNAGHAATSSWLVALCLSMMTTSAILSYQQKIPIITAWSTPGAALIAASNGISMEQAVGAFLFCGALIICTGFIGFLGTVVRKIPASIATGILAGVLLPFVQAVVANFENDVLMGGGMLMTYLLLRLRSPSWAVIGVLVCGLAVSFLYYPIPDAPTLEVASLTLAKIHWDWTTIVGLGLPLYIVTMASQNLPGIAVLKSAGYIPETKSIFVLTGMASFINGLFGAHSIGLAAITASICASEDADPDKHSRWITGLCYAAGYGALAFFAPMLISFFASLPPEFIINLAGIALIGPFMSALSSSFSAKGDLMPGTMAFIVTSSGVTMIGVGAAFWGLVAGLLVIFLSYNRKAAMGDVRSKQPQKAT